MRRTRYNIKYVDRLGQRQEIQILAYSETYCREYVERRLGQVISCAPARRRHAPHYDWQLDDAAIRQIADFLDLRLPIKFRFTRGQVTLGSHRIERDPTLHHHITLSRAISAERAARVVWHELAHAMQSERFNPEGGLEPLLSYWREQRNYSYNRRPCELEANEYEDYATEINPIKP